MKALRDIARHPRITLLSVGEDGGAATYERTKGAPLRIVFSWGGGWDHVSVSRNNSVPAYEDMKKIKQVFFKPDEVAVEYHAPDADHVNIHDHCLHLWRPQNVEMPMPPKEFV